MLQSLEMRTMQWREVRIVACGKELNADEDGKFLNNYTRELLIVCIVAERLLHYRVIEGD